MISATWAETTLKSTFASGSTPIPFAAQRTADGKTLVLRAVNQASAVQPLSVSLTGGIAASGPATQWTLAGKPSDDNTPSAPTNVSPVQSSLPLTPGATGVALSLPAHAFVILSIPL